MKASPLRYIRVGSTEEAISVLAEHGDEAKLLAGGQSLVPMLNLRLAAPAMLVDIGRVDELRHLEVTDSGLRAGALTTHRVLETSAIPGMRDRYGVVPEAARLIGHYPVRTRGTIGGSLAHADPTAEWCVLSLALGAEIVMAGPSGQRRVSADDFFLGFLTTALQPDDLLLEVSFPAPAPHARLVEFARRHGDFGIVVVAVNLDLDLDGGRCHGGRVAVGGAASVPMRITEAEDLLTDVEWSEELVGEVAATVGRVVQPSSDVHASSRYRKRLAAALTRRALREAAVSTTQGVTAQ